MPRVRVLVIGGVVAVVSGLFGLGGPLLSVPLLIAAGAPMLGALAAAQAQSVVVAGLGTIGYAAQGNVSWSLALLIGVPQLVGVVIGWRLAHTLPTDRLRLALAGVLIVVGPYLILRNASPARAVRGPRVPMRTRGPQNRRSESQADRRPPNSVRKGLVGVVGGAQ